MISIELSSYNSFIWKEPILSFATTLSTHAFASERLNLFINVLLFFVVWFESCLSNMNLLFIILKKKSVHFEARTFAS